MKEEVAILLTTYNGEKYLSDQIESIMNQTFQDFVCLVHDDGSSDHTMDILQEKKRIYGEKIVILDYPRQGTPRDNFLSLIEYADTPYIMFADQDDFWLPEKIQKTLDMMKRGEKQSGYSAVAVYSNVKVVDEKLRVIDESFYSYTRKNPMKTALSDLIMGNVALGCTMMINRELYRRYTKSELTTIPNHDWLFMLLGKSCGSVYYMQESLMLYRQHSKNMVGALEGKGLFDKIKDVVGLKALQEKLKEEKHTIQRQRKRAQELLNFDLIENSEYEFLSELKDIGSKRKWKRIRFYVSWRLYTKHNMLLVLIAC